MLGSSGCLNGRDRIPGLYAWGSIALFFLLFFPFGIYLVWKRSRCDRKTDLALWKWFLFFGCIFLMGAISFWKRGPIYGDKNLMLPCILAAAAFFLGSYRLRKRSFRFRQYAIMIYDKGVTETECLAESIHEAETVVREDFKVMKEKGYFPREAFLDEAEGIIVIPDL